MKNYRLELCYDGTKYNGWQKLGSTENTIQNRVEQTLSRLLSQEVSVSASGRTDAGVHARKQVCSFACTTEMTCDEMLHGLRAYLPQDIGALSLCQAEERFHARYCCKAKTYVYRVRTDDSPAVFERNTFYRYPGTFDIVAMRQAADLLCGRHDFAAFTTAKKQKKSTERTIFSIDLLEEEHELRLIFTGDGFLYNMVRIMAGTLLEVGSGKRRADDIPVIFASGKRENAGFTAPACGLTLWEIQY